MLGKIQISDMKIDDGQIDDGHIIFLHPLCYVYDAYEQDPISDFTTMKYMHQNLHLYSSIKHLTQTILNTKK